MQNHYTQNDEQEVILDYFADSPPGRLLDIGAHDGITFSNSLALIENGWGGVLVEPNPGVIADLIRLHGGNDRVKILNCAVSPQPFDLMQFWANNDGVASTDSRRNAYWQGYGMKFNPIWIAPIKPDLLAQFAGPVDFVTIDVEDSNLSLAIAMKDYLSQVRLVCIEHTAGGMTCGPGLLQLFVDEMKFRKLHMTGENLIFARE